MWINQYRGLSISSQIKTIKKNKKGDTVAVVEEMWSDASAEAPDEREAPSVMSPRRNKLVY